MKPLRRKWVILSLMPGLCAALVAFHPGALAIDAEGNYRVFGERSCDAWVGVRKDLNKEDKNFLVFLSIVSWISGYLTAYNNYTKNIYNIMGETDLDSIHLWVDKYCRENPLSGVADAMELLIPELWPRRIIKKPDAQ